MAAPKVVFTTKEVGDLTGQEMRTVIYRIDARMIVPEHQEAAGHGTKRLLGVRNLVEAVVVEELYRAFFEGAMIKKLMASLRVSSDFKTMYHRAGEMLSGLGGLRDCLVDPLTGRTPREGDEKRLAGPEGHVGSLVWVGVRGRPGIAVSLETGEEAQAVIDLETEEMVRLGEPVDTILALKAFIIPGVPLDKFSMERDVVTGLPEDSKVERLIHGLDFGPLEAKVYAAAGL